MEKASGHDAMLSIPAEITKATTMANGVIRLQIDSQENINPNLIAKLFSMVNKIGFACFLPELRPIVPADVIDLPKLELTPEDGDRSPAQRLRASFYILWEQKGKDGDFEAFYRARMERIINAVKEKLA